MASQFHVTLPSNASMNVHTQNTVANFTTVLPNRIELEGDWEVAMVDFSYPVTWHNVPKGEFFQIMVMSGGKDVGEGPIRISEGRYESGKDLIESMMQSWRDYWEMARRESRYVTHAESKALVDPGTRLTPVERINQKRRDHESAPDTNHASVSMTFNEKTNKAKIKLTQLQHELVLSPRLKDIMSMKNNTWTVPRLRWVQETVKTYESETEVDINRGCHTIFVYCSVVQDSIVGDVRAPLLRAVTVRGKTGQTTHESFTRPIYLPLKANNFDTVEVNIKSEDGSLVPFAYGNSYVTLHFRRATL